MAPGKAEALLERPERRLPPKSTPAGPAGHRSLGARARPGTAPTVRVGMQHPRTEPSRTHTMRPEQSRSCWTLSSSRGRLAPVSVAGGRPGSTRHGKRSRGVVAARLASVELVASMPSHCRRPGVRDRAHAPRRALGLRGRRYGQAGRASRRAPRPPGRARDPRAPKERRGLSGSPCRQIATRRGMGVLG